MVVLVTMVKPKIDFSNMGLSPSFCEVWFSLPLATWATLMPRNPGQQESGISGIYPSHPCPSAKILRHKPGPQILVCRCWDGRITWGEVSSIVLVTCLGQWLVTLSLPGTLSLQSSSGSLLTTSDITLCCPCPPVYPLSSQAILQHQL